jgi:hypothetical protein
MEKANVIALLEKYWRTETSVEEEKALADWFNAQDPDTLDPDLQGYGPLFAYFGEEARVSPGPGFEARILQAVTAADAETSAAAMSPAAMSPAAMSAAASPVPPRSPVFHFQWGLVSAAAAVLFLVASLFLLQPNQKHPVETPVTADTRAVAGTPVLARVTDTYDDPEQALAAVRHALLIASAHLNEGRKQITNK